MAKAGILPMCVKIGDETRDEDQVERAIANDLIGDPDVAAFGVTRFWQCHDNRLTVRRCGQVKTIWSAGPMCWWGLTLPHVGASVRPDV